MTNEQMKEQKPKKKRQYSRKTLIKEIEKLELIGLTDIARLLDWNTSKVATYVLRGVIPDPLLEISGRPVWHKPEVLQAAKANKLKIWDLSEDEYEDKLSAEERTKRQLERTGAEAKKHPVGA